MAVSRRSFLASFASNNLSLRITFKAGVSEHRGYRHHAPQARVHVVAHVVKATPNIASHVVRGNRLRATRHATGHAPRLLSIPALCHGCCLPSGTCDVRAVMLPPVQDPPSKLGPSLPGGGPREYLGSITTKSQVPYGGSSRASSQAWLAVARVSAAHATRPIRSQQGRPPAALAPLD